MVLRYVVHEDLVFGRGGLRVWGGGVFPRCAPGTLVVY